MACGFKLLFPCEFSPVSCGEYSYIGKRTNSMLWKMQNNPFGRPTHAHASSLPCKSYESNILSFYSPAAGNIKQLASVFLGANLQLPFLIFIPLFQHVHLLSLEHKDWRKTVPSYTQSSSTMDFRTWSSLPRDDSLEPLPYNWEMAYTETGMVYFIE